MEKLGGQENTIRAIIKAAITHLPAEGIFEDVVIKVAGSTVYVRGRVMNGIPKIGTFFIP